MKTNVEISAAAKAMSSKIVDREIGGVKTPCPINREELVKAVNDKQAEVEKAYKSSCEETDGALRIALLTKAKNLADELAVAMLALETFDCQTARSDSAVDKIKAAIRECGLPTHIAPKSGSLADYAPGKQNWFTRVF